MYRNYADISSDIQALGVVVSAYNSLDLAIVLTASVSIYVCVLTAAFTAHVRLIVLVFSCATTTLITITTAEPLPHAPACSRCDTDSSSLL
jgi:hypothetical protein